jgi:hypothetical protein
VLAGREMKVVFSLICFFEFVVCGLGNWHIPNGIRFDTGFFLFEKKASLLMQQARNLTFHIHLDLVEDLALLRVRQKQKTLDFFYLLMVN